jgi:hypothetical protein
MKDVFVGRTLGFREVEAPRISRQLANESGKVVRPTLKIFLVLISVTGGVCVEGLSQ